MSLMQWDCVHVGEIPRQLCNNLLHKFICGQLLSKMGGQSVDDIRNYIPHRAVDAHRLAVPRGEAALASGSSGTIFDPAAIRAAYLPPHNPPRKIGACIRDAAHQYETDLVLCFIYPPLCQSLRAVRFVSSPTGVPLGMCKLQLDEIGMYTASNADQPG